MSTQTEIARLQTARNKLRTKGVELGINTGTDKLDVIATAFDNIENHAAVNVDVKEGESYTIPKGYHNGGGKVSGVAGGGNYTLQSKTVTPTKSQKSVAPDQGYYGLASVVVNAIPDNFQDVTPVTAAAGDVLANKVIVAADGSTVAGTMPNNGSVTPDVLPAGKSYTIPKGYHDGTGKVTALNLWDQTDGNAISDEMLEGVTAWVKGFKITGTMPNRGNVNKVLDTETPSFKIPWGAHYGDGTISISLEEKTATPTKAKQEIAPTGGKVLSKVTVNPIPDAYQNVTGVTAGAEDVLTGKVIVDAEGNEITGAIPVWNDTDLDGLQLPAGQGFTYDAGYHKYDTTIYAQDLASQTPGDAAAANILSGKKAWVAGSQVTGSMPNNGAKSLTIDGLTVTSVAIPAGYHNGSGTVSLTSDIEEALAAI